MSRRGMVGFAAAACVACCAGPFLAAIGGIAALGAIGTMTFGVVALLLTGAAIVALAFFRKRRRGQARKQSQPVEDELGPALIRELRRR